jgi:hypothetical protein
MAEAYNFNVTEQQKVPYRITAAATTVDNLWNASCHENNAANYKMSDNYMRTCVSVIK